MRERIVSALNPFKILRYVNDVRESAVQVSALYGVPVRKIVREQILLYLRSEMRRDEYYRYHLFSPELTWEQKRAFISSKELRRVQVKLNPCEYFSLFKNKLLFKRYFENAGLPVSPLLGVFDPAWGRTREGLSFRNTADVEQWLPTVPPDGVVFKPIEGADGRAILVCRGGKEGTLTAVDGTHYDARGIFDFMTDGARLRRAYDGGEPKTAFLAESRIVQHERLAALCPDTVCSVRVVTLCSDDGTAEVIGAVFKLSFSRSGVDNLHAGGLGVGIERSTGRLMQGRALGDMWKPYVSTLPNGTRFEGTQLPHWDAVLRVACRAAEAFPFMKAIGWDIAITQDGPVIIEGNWGWGADVVQIGSLQGMMTASLAACYGGKTSAKPVGSMDGEG